MIHDAMVSGQAGRSTTDDRRAAARFPCPAEITLSWLHDCDTILRFRLVDVSADGFRLRTTLPVRNGTTGIARRLLPEGTPLDYAVAVAWVKPAENGTYEVGLRRIE